MQLENTQFQVLEEALQTALGGPAYVVSGLLTRYGHLVGIHTHLIVCYIN